MGLDMYFYAKHESYESYGEWDQDRQDNTNYPDNLKLFGDFVVNTCGRRSRIETVEYKVGYFRKFNALHNYIVKTFADGEDNCQEIYLSLENLSDVLNKLKLVLDNKDKAAELFPTTSGCFFGSTNYDEDYFTDVKVAVELFEMLVNDLDHDYYDVVYQASW